MMTKPHFGCRLTARVLVPALLTPPLPAFAQAPATVAAGSGNTAVYTSANGVAVVNINTANGAGLSHNKFTTYNVPVSGLVLNNGNSAQAARASQLAGLVAANKNLGAQAAVILNEVVSSNRSVMNGYTEVLGGRADVVVANPNGITCAGCGFINTNRVSLVTGTPNLNADGSLRDFSVSRGDLLINGAGLNASAQQYLDLVSRSVKVDGQINVPVLRITTGNNVWNYGSALVTGATTPEGAIPAFAFDSTVLGGMYAGRIAVVASESGVGVRMLGQAAASADDFSINAAGKIEVGGKVSAARDVKLASTSAAADAIALADASLSARRNLELTAASGGATLSGGVLVADNNLAMTFGTLSDVASASAVTDNNQRYAGNTLSVNASGAASLDGVNYGAGTALDAGVGSLAIGAGSATLYSNGTLKLHTTASDLALAKLALSSAGDMTLASDHGALSLAGDAKVKSTGKLALSAATGLSNASTLKTDSGDIVIRSGGAFTDSGEIWAGGALDVADLASAGSQDVTVSGSGKLGGQTVKLRGKTLSLADGAVLTSTGDMDLELDRLAVASGARIVGASLGSGTLRLNASSSAIGREVFDNSGLVHSGHDLAVSGLNVSSVSGGVYSAANNLTWTLAGGEIKSQLLAGQDLTISGKAGNLVFENTVSAGRNITIRGERVRNWATINAGNDIDICVSDGSGSALFSNAGGNDDETDAYHLGTTPSPYIAQVIAGNSISIWGGVSLSLNTGLISAPTVTINLSKIANFGTVRGTTVNTFGDFKNGMEGSSRAAGTVTRGSFAATSLTPVASPGAISFGGVTITLPTTPNGLYVPALNPTSRYLVESNPLYFDMSKFIGSDYLQSQLAASGTPKTTSSAASASSILAAAGYDPELTTKRLGDAAYETYLVRQQLITLTGSNIVSGFATEYAQMKGLMDHAVSQVANLGLTYGKALSASQQAGLKEDMVWMVETTVNGQKVLTPVVYLSAATRQLFDGTATVAGDAVNMNVSSLYNSGAIRGNAIDITASGDVRNVGGTIKGGEVSVASTGGSVINTAQVDEQIIRRDGYIDLKTTVGQAGRIESTGTLSLAAAKNVENVGGSIQGKDVKLTAGGDVVNSAIVATNVSGSAYRENVAATGSIVATNGLTVAAGRDVQNLGAQLSSAGDTALVAGRDVTVDTVALTNRDSSTSSTRSFVGNSNSRTTTTSVDQVQSGVAAGGTLAIKAGQDVTLAAAKVSAGDSVAIDAARDLNIVARDRSTQTISESNASGVGVGGGVYGNEKKTTDQFASRAVGSTLTTVEVGGAQTALANAKGSVKSSGDISLTAGKTATLEGAKVSSAGATSIAAQDVAVLAAKDVDRTTTTTETTSYLSTSKGDGDKSSTQAKAGVKSDGVVKAGANASATNDAGGVDLVKKTTTRTFDEDTRSVGSQLTSAGGLSIVSRNDTTLQGAEVKAGGDVSLVGQNVSILAAQNTHVSTSSTTTTKVGLYASTTNAADAKAGAGASANAAIGTANANAGANATANAGSSTSIDVMRTKTTETESVDVTNKGTTLAAAGNLSINSAKTLTVQGSDVSGDKGVELKAKDMAFVAAQDSHTSSTSTTATSAGLYLDGNANASATANASANAGLGANAGARSEAGANAVASVGVQGRNVTSGSSEGSSTARVSSITSGSGSITRQAGNSISDVGTVIDAAADFSQSAKTITSKAAENTSYSSSDSTTNTAKVGVYAKAEAGASADAGANAGLGLDGKPKAEAGASAEAKAKVGAGVKASYSRDTASSGVSSSEAVVSTIRAGGKVTSVSGDKTTLEGTQIAAGAGGVEIQAATLDFSAAKSTTASASSTDNVNASASVGVSRGTGKGVDVDVAAGTSSTRKSSETSTATAGSITTTGDLLIKTSGDTRLAGTNLAAIGDTTVAAGGNLVFDAARDTASSSKSAYDASASVSTSSSQSAGGANSAGVDASVAGGFSRSSAESSTAAAGSINTGGKLTLSAGKAASFEGTTMAAGGDATISAKDGVTISAARSTTESESYGARVGVGAGSSKESTAAESSSGKSVSATVEGNYSAAKSSAAQAGSLTSGGNLKIVSGQDVTLEGTTLAADGKASVLAGGTVNFMAAESTSSSVGVGASLSASAEKTDKTSAAAPPKAASKNPGTGGTQGSDGSAQSNADLAKWQKNQASVVEQLKARQSGSTSTAATQGSGAASAATADAAGPTTESKSSASLGVQLQTKNSTVQQAGSITAGAGGVEVVAAGGNVNLVGTNITTAGDADISAKGDVNISATRSTRSGINVAVAASADRASEAPTGKSAAGAKTAATANGPANSGASAAKPSGTNSAASPSASAEKKTPPPVPTAPKPERKSAEAAPSTVATPPAAAATAKKTPPPVPTAPKPARQNAASSAATPATGKAAATTQETAKSSAAATTAASEKDPNKFGGSVAGATNTDENKSSTFVGVGGGGSVKNGGATIKTGGKVTIKSGGKTRLTNTDIKSAGGQNIDAKGGVERKTEKDTSVLNASSDSGPASTGQGMSKVPTASANPATGAPAAPGTPGMAATESNQGTSAAPQSALKAAQGQNSTPAIKKN